MTSEQSLRGRTALITGVSRVNGIGAAVARRLASRGANLVLHHHQPHDREQPWGADDLAEVFDSIESQLHAGATITELAGDLATPQAPAELISQANAAAGHLDILVCNHARSGADTTLANITAADLDAHWASDARSVLLLTQSFAAQHDAERGGGRVIWMTSGQQQGPLHGEIAYGAAKSVLAGMTLTVADELADHNILLNTVNPGPVNTGFLSPGNGIDANTLAALQAQFPTRRFGTPDDPARLIAWLVAEEGEWITGQVLNTEGGFRRWARPSN